MSTLEKENFVKIKKSDNLIQDFQGCGINSLITVLRHIKKDNKISVDDVKKIFDFDKDGISEERHRFNRFNNLLKDNYLLKINQYHLKSLRKNSTKTYIIKTQEINIS